MKTRRILGLALSLYLSASAIAADEKPSGSWQHGSGSEHKYLFSPSLDGQSWMQIAFYPRGRRACEAFVPMFTYPMAVAGKLDVNRRFALKVDRNVFPMMGDKTVPVEMTFTETLIPDPMLVANIVKDKPDQKEATRSYVFDSFMPGLLYSMSKGTELIVSAGTYEARFPLRGFQAVMQKTQHECFQSQSIFKPAETNEPGRAAP